MRLLIIGAGGYGLVVREVAEAIAVYEKINFLDDNSVLAVAGIAGLQALRNEYDATSRAICARILSLRRISYVRKVFETWY